MSLPLKRRMARVALLVAAAAPVIGLGAASASAAGLPQAADLGGLSSTDTASALGGNVDSAAHKATGVANQAGTDAAKTLAPAAAKSVADTGKTLTPAARKTVGDAAGQVGHSANQTAGSAHGTQGVTDALPLHGLSTTGSPAQSLPGGLPTL